MKQPRKNGYRGMAFNEPAQNEAPPENGLVRLYIGPSHEGGKIHWVNTPYGEGLLCRPNIPVGRFIAQPDATDATCGRCSRIKRDREDRTRRAKEHAGG